MQKVNWLPHYQTTCLSIQKTSTLLTGTQPNISTRIVIFSVLFTLHWVLEHVHVSTLPGAGESSSCFRSLYELVNTKCSYQRLKHWHARLYSWVYLYLLIWYLQCLNTDMTLSSSGFLFFRSLKLRLVLPVAIDTHVLANYDKTVWMKESTTPYNTV